MIKREASQTLINLAKQYKAVAVVGPRQSGKTTLVKSVFPHLPYVNLETPDIRNFAINDARGFLEQYKNGAIFDEIQRVPELFSYLQQILDEISEPGRFILSGSNNFLLQESISQSLAGRVAYLFLLPFTYNELNLCEDIDQIMCKGMYPPIYSQNLDYNKWYQNYIRTYIERDVRQIKNITNLYLFERFVKLCAGRTGQLLNMNSLAVETGIDSKTVASWISVLEASFVVFKLQPHYVNFNKRLVKMPKLYFYDTGLVCSLIGIKNKEQLTLHPLRGNIFENFVISELIKFRYNIAESNNLYFWRDNTGNEIDIICDNAGNLLPIEVKSGKTISDEFLRNIKIWQKISGQNKAYVIYAGESIQKRSNEISIFPWNKIRDFL